MQDLKSIMVVYNILPITLKQNKTGVSINSNCNSITIINYGTTIITVNGVITLYPGTPGTNSGESISLGGNIGEVYKGRLDIAFSALAGNNCLILQKIYDPNFKL